MHPIEKQWQRLQECKRFLKDSRDRGTNDLLDQKLTLMKEAGKLGKLLEKEGFNSYPKWKKSKENQ